MSHIQTGWYLDNAVFADIYLASRLFRNFADDFTARADNVADLVFDFVADGRQIGFAGRAALEFLVKSAAVRSCAKS